MSFLLDSHCAASDNRRRSRNQQRVRRVAIASSYMVAMVFALLPAQAQPSGGSAPSAAAATEIPRLPDGHPDLNGVWQIPYTPDMSRALGGKLPFTARGEAEWKAFDVGKFDYTGHCLPPGLTRAINTPDPIEISQTKDNVVILFEAFSSFISVHTDGRPHPAKIEPTWFGNSVGRWDGDTLVID